MEGASTHANVRRNLPEAEESRHEYSGFPAVECEVELFPSLNLKLREVFRGLATEQWPVEPSEAVLKPACRSPSPPEPNKCLPLFAMPHKRAKRAIREQERSKKYSSLHPSLIHSSNRSFWARTPPGPAPAATSSPWSPLEGLRADDKRRVGARRQAAWRRWRWERRRGWAEEGEAAEG
jgi:hypothetical protein